MVIDCFSNSVLISLIGGSILHLGCKTSSPMKGGCEDDGDVIGNGGIESIKY